MKYNVKSTQFRYLIRNENERKRVKNIYFIGYLILKLMKIKTNKVKAFCVSFTVASLDLRVYCTITHSIFEIIYEIKGKRP